MINFLLHLLLLRRFWLPEKLVCNVRLLLLGFGYRDTGEDISLVDSELVFEPGERIFLVLSLVKARVAFVEVRMLRLQHMQNTPKPEQISFLLLKVFDQIVARLSAGHLLHYTDQFTLHLSLARGLGDTDGPDLCHTWHVNFTSQNLVQKLHGDDLSVLGWQEPLLPEHEFVERVKVRKEGVDGILEGHFLND